LLRGHEGAAFFLLVPVLIDLAGKNKKKADTGEQNLTEKPKGKGGGGGMIEI
jgi:hypothetical protein